MYQFQQLEEEENKKVIKIKRNGDQLGKEYEFEYNQDYTFFDLKQIFEDRFDFKKLRILRLFNQDGVELQEEDLKYVQNNSTIIVSGGEDYDTKSFFYQYKKIKDIGKGGFGTVYLAQHVETQEQVAIKLISTHQSQNASDIDMIFKDGNILRNLNHKNIVQIISCYTMENFKVAFIMEYLEGGELASYVKKKERLDEYEARKIAIQIVDAIIYCHRQGIIHRDLKLENILLKNPDDSSLIKIIDFGISGSSMNINVEHINIGSLKYMPPEILLNKIKTIGASIDIWAIGIIIYAMVCGQMPFSGQNAQELVKQITQKKVQIPKDIEKSVSYEFKDLISKILIKDRKLRITLKDLEDHPWFINTELSFYKEEPIIEPEKEDSGKKKLPQRQKSVNFSKNKVQIVVDDSKRNSKNNTRNKFYSPKNVQLTDQGSLDKRHQTSQKKYKESEQIKIMKMQLERAEKILKRTKISPSPDDESIQNIKKISSAKQFKSILKRQKSDELNQVIQQHKIIYTQSEKPEYKMSIKSIHQTLADSKFQKPPKGPPKSSRLEYNAQKEQEKLEENINSYKLPQINQSKQKMPIPTGKSNNITAFRNTQLNSPTKFD